MPRPQVADEFAQAVIERAPAEAYPVTTKGLLACMSLDEFVQALGAAEEDAIPPGTFGLSSNPTTFGYLAKDDEELSTPLPSGINRSSPARGVL